MRDSKTLVVADVPPSADESRGHVAVERRKAERDRSRVDCGAITRQGWVALGATRRIAEGDDYILLVGPFPDGAALTAGQARRFGVWRGAEEHMDSAPTHRVLRVPRKRQPFDRSRCVVRWCHHRPATSKTLAIQAIAPAAAALALRSAQYRPLQELQAYCTMVRSKAV